MKKVFLTAVLCFVFSLFGGLYSTANAATRTVDTTLDIGALTACTAAAANDCSLRGAITGAAPGDVIEFAAPLFDSTQTIILDPSLGSLVPAVDMTINGKGANLTTISGGNQVQVFVLVGNVSLSGLTITGGRITNTHTGRGAGIYNDGNSTITDCLIVSNMVIGATNGATGGGIYNAPGKQLTIVGSTVWANSARSNNTAGIGGGILNAAGAVLTIINSTVVGNDAQLGGSGIFSSPNATLNIINSTITQNHTVAGAIGGVYHAGGSGSTRVVNSIVTGNTSDHPGTIQNIHESSLNLNLQNFFNNNAQLGAFGNNGGTTPTFAPASELSPVVGGGSGCVLTAGGCGFGHLALTTDQRGAGFPRLSGSAIDIGSVEADTFTFAPSTLPAASLNTAYSQQIIVTGGTAPHAFTLNSGTLPNGITLSSDGLLSGTTAQAGEFNFTIRATGANGFYALKNYVLSAGYYVTNANSFGASSLRQLINDVPAGGTIRFDPAFFNQPRTIFARLNIFKHLTIIGPGSGLLTIDGEGGGRVLNIDGGPTVTISGIRFVNGDTGGGVSAGGILINGGSRLDATDIIVENCTAGVHGGGIYNTGTLNLTRSTVRGNSAGQNGGGIYHDGGTMGIDSSTISGNTAGAGGGVFTNSFSIINNSTISGNTTIFNGSAAFIQSGGQLDSTNTTITDNVSTNNLTGGIFNSGMYRTRNSIIAGNRNQSGTGAQDIAGTITSFGYNLIGSTTGNSFAADSPSLTGNLTDVSANLAPLSNYGGLTQTHALLPNSQAINAGDLNNNFTADQRGSMRPIGGRVDIGSFERSITFDQSTLPSGNINIAYSQTLTVTRAAGFAERPAAEKIDSSDSNSLLAPFAFSVVTIAGQSLPPGLTLLPSGTLSGTPTAPGVYTFTVKAADTDAMAGASQFTIQVFGPTAANVSVSGRILTTNGAGVSNARVILTDSSGNSRTVLTGSFGYYSFEDVAAGEIYVVSVVSKRFSFAPLVISVVNEVTELNLVANK